jgi:hypothetical protein
MSDSEDFCSSSDDEVENMVIETDIIKESDSEDDSEAMAELRTLVNNSNSNNDEFYEELSNTYEKREENKKEKKGKELEKFKKKRLDKCKDTKHLDWSDPSFVEKKFIPKSMKKKYRRASVFNPLLPPLEVLKQNGYSNNKSTNSVRNSGTIDINDSPKEYPSLKKN